MATEFVFSIDEGIFQELVETKTEATFIRWIETTVLGCKCQINV